MNVTPTVWHDREIDFLASRCPPPYAGVFIFQEIGLGSRKVAQSPNWTPTQQNEKQALLSHSKDLS